MAMVLGIILTGRATSPHVSYKANLLTSVDLDAMHVTPYAIASAISYAFPTFAAPIFQLVPVLAWFSCNRLAF